MKPAYLGNSGTRGAERLGAGRRSSVNRASEPRVEASLPAKKRCLIVLEVLRTPPPSLSDRYG